MVAELLAVLVACADGIKPLQRFVVAIAAPGDQCTQVANAVACSLTDFFRFGIPRSGQRLCVDVLCPVETVEQDACFQLQQGGVCSAGRLRQQAFAEG